MPVLRIHEQHAEALGDRQTDVGEFTAQMGQGPHEMDKALDWDEAAGRPHNASDRLLPDRPPSVTLAGDAYARVDHMRPDPWGPLCDSLRNRNDQISAM